MRESPRVIQRFTLPRRISLAITTVPDATAWRRTTLEIAWLLPAILLCGGAGNFLDFGVTDDLRGLASLALFALFAPALGEELIFRAAILPRPEERPDAKLSIALSICVFVLWHPLQALIFGADKVPIFLDPWFLAAVAALGLALARLYRSSGSIWPCVALHWLVVVGWKAFLGGPPNPFA